LLKVACWLDSVAPNPAKKGLKYWCQDETRIGLKTIERKKITARGVKPIGLVQWNFKAYYLYGAVAPQTGENFWLEFSHLDGQCFQIFLDNLAAEYPEHLNVVVRIQVFDWGIREGINKSQEWADIASRKKAIARIP
jgi:hypothetical protein